MSLNLKYVRGRAAGVCDGPDGHPKFCGTITEDGRIRIDCHNYPEHWQEAQLSMEWVQAYEAYKKRSRETPSTATSEGEKV